MSNVIGNPDIGISTWLYLLPSLKYLVNNNNFNVIRENPTGDALLLPYKKVPEGIKMHIILGIASVFEGMIRSYLNNILISASSKQTGQSIDSLDFVKLIKSFESITGKDFNNTIDGTMNSYSLEDIQILFLFRNYVIHGSPIFLNFNGELSFRAISQKLETYIQNHNLTPTYALPEGEVYHFIEKLFTDKLIYHFYDMLIRFLNSPIGNSFNGYSFYSIARSEMD